MKSIINSCYVLGTQSRADGNSGEPK